jgi:glycosyltransferase involved in cell wall biosynthesis
MKNLQVDSIRELNGRPSFPATAGPLGDSAIDGQEAIRVLYSFPFRIGAGQICHTALQQVVGASKAGVNVTVVAGSVAPSVMGKVVVRKTLSLGLVRFPVRLLGRLRYCRLHDWMVSRMLPRMRDEVDLIHGWPLASLLTIRAAKKLGIPMVIERPNAHTAFAQQVVDRECRRLGVDLPDGHEHSLNHAVLEREECEYNEAFALLCPSGFVVRSFLDRGFEPSKLLLHSYGYDQERFSPTGREATGSKGLTMVFVGGAAPRKGLHIALRAWHESGAAKRGRFLICGGFMSGYQEALKGMLDHPSIEVLGHREDVEKWMRSSDVFVLPSVEEGSALVTYEARGSGCVLLVSDAAGARCSHMETGLIHRAGEVDELTRHLRLLDQDRGLLEKLRSRSVQELDQLTWTSAGKTLANLYRDTVARAGFGDRAIH